MQLHFFQTQTLYDASRTLFQKELKLPLSGGEKYPFIIADVLGARYKANNPVHKLIEDIFFVGMIDDVAFSGLENAWTTKKAQSLNKNYDGLLIFAVNLSKKENQLLPNKSELGEISHALSSSFRGMPIITIFKYGDYIALASHERIDYLQTWREGEKIGKVSLLKDIHISKPHSAHLRILQELSLTDKQNIRNFAELHEHLRNTLSISKLNKQFYKELFDWYIWAVERVKFPQIRPEKDCVADSVHQSESLIRLLTRLLFVWFMKEKNLINADLFDKNKLSAEILSSDFDPEKGENTVYYRAILQNLFFATLNNPMDKRLVLAKNKYPNKNYGNYLIYRFKEYFQEPDNCVRYFERTPFLNGGLFDCLDQRKDEQHLEEIRLDGFSSVLYKQAILPDKLFFGTHYIETQAESDKTETTLFAEPNKSKGKNSVMGLIEILHKYKFTIEENTPLEEEIALDPELLGKVFENLLASYNPETQSTARKQTGSFYTPREIVDYMVEESLIAYLLPKIADYHDLKVAQNPTEPSAIQCLRTLLAFSNEINPFDGAETQLLMEAINTCKILDPACGSGAFPMGVLQKMIFILKKLDPQNEIWLEMVVQNFPPSLQSKMREKLKQENLDYVRKLGIIQECIYGIDIQPIATQIAKLRFFISLLVDQKGDDSKENRGFEPLPNLDFKIVTANSLISAPKNELVEKAGYTKNMLAKFENLTNEYFNAHVPEEKDKTKRAIEACINEVVKANEIVINQYIKVIEKGKNSLSAAKLKAREKELAASMQDLNQWESYKNLFKHEAVGFFEIQYFFPQVKKGFDIVIGNPPYVNTKRGLDNNLKNIYEMQYKLAKGQYDLFTLFIEKALSIASLVCYIVPKPLINNENYKEARKMLLDNGLSSIVIGSDIFESAGVESCIFISAKQVYATNVTIYEYLNYTFQYRGNVDLAYYLKSPSFIFSTESSEEDIRLILNIEENTFLLGNLINITRGVEAGKSDESIYFCNDLETCTEYKLIRGEDMGKYKLGFHDLYIDFDEGNKTKFKSKELYFREKLLIRRVGNELIATYDNEGFVVLNTIYCAYMQVSSMNLKYVVALLNSRLINYWFKKTYSNTDKLFPYIRVSQIERIPIYAALFEMQQPFILLVEYILWLNNAENAAVNEYVSNEHLAKEFEEVLDAMVFELYFGESIKQKECDVLAYIQKEYGFESISEELSEAEKAVRINHAYNAYRQREHVVRNRVILQRMRVEEVQIIMGAKKGL